MQLSPKKTLLVIRLGAMGEILHALPAVSNLRASFPDHTLSWLVARKWLPLLLGNPAIDELIPFERDGLRALHGLRRTLRALRPKIAIDFQGLVQSAFAGRLSKPERFFGFDRSVAREPLAARFYSDQVHVTGPHRIERNIQLVEATGAHRLASAVWLPQGTPEGELPDRPFILASPFAGWQSKQWPIDRYDELGRLLRAQGVDLVLNAPSGHLAELRFFRNVVVQHTSLPGLIHATRRALAVVGVDSGPLHLAAALKKPGVALFGPTDPAQTGPFDSPMLVLRDATVQTSYKRSRATHPAMESLSVSEVFAGLMPSVTAAVETA